MSKSKTKKEISSLRQQFHKSLETIGFIKEIQISEERSIEIKEDGNSGLKKVIIDELTFSSEIEKIWEIDLESKDYPGLSTGNKTPEKAILILQKKINQDGDILNYHLSICLVELKASLQPKKKGKDKDEKSTLKQINEKFQCAMNRMYLLLSLNDHTNSQKNYRDKQIIVNFKGLIFYNRNEIKDGDIEAETSNLHDSSESALYKILSNPTQSRLLTVATLLEELDKIKIKFIENPDTHRDFITIKLEDLLN